MFLAALTLAVPKSHAAPVPLAGLNSYSQVFQDAVTGDNTFLAPDPSDSDASEEVHWFINQFADDYQNEVYERPVAQTFNEYTYKSAGAGADSGGFTDGDTVVATDTNNPAYYAYIDIVKGYAHIDRANKIMYFAIQVYGDEKFSSEPGESDPPFGESTLYRIRISDADEALNKAISREGLLFGVEGKDLTDTFNTDKVFGYYDEDGDAGGQGVSKTLSDGDGTGNYTGYEETVISDGQIEGGPKEDTDVLWARRPKDGNGAFLPIVEFAFDYGTFNMAYPDFSIIPDDGDDLSFLLFETTKGLQDNANYFWNDKYFENNIGSVYIAGDNNQNIYELDTLRAGFSQPGQIIPFPPAVWAGILGFTLLAAGKYLRMIKLQQCHD